MFLSIVRVCECLFVCLRVWKGTPDKGTQTKCGFHSCESKALGEAINKWFQLALNGKFFFY